MHVFVFVESEITILVMVHDQSHFDQYLDLDQPIVPELWWFEWMHQDPLNESFQWMVLDRTGYVLLQYVTHVSIVVLKIIPC